MPKQRFAFASLSVIIFLTSSNLVAGQGSCPKITALPSFDTKSFLGIWWMFAVSPASSPITNSRCQHVAYSYVNDNEVKVTEYGVNGTSSSDSGTLKQKAKGQFDVSLPRFKETKIIYTRLPNPPKSVVNQALQAGSLSEKDLKFTDLNNCK